MDIITSLDNSSVKEARSLNDKKYRRNLGEFLIEGKKLVKEAIQKDLNITKLFVDSSKAAELENIIVSSPAPVLFCLPNVLKSISDTITNQGIIAVSELPSVGLYTYKQPCRLLVLDRISDPGNMGTIIRTALAVGFNEILTIDCVDPYSPKVVRASSGGVFTAQIYPFTEGEVIELVKKYNISLLVSDMLGESIYNSEVYTNYALVIGNEGRGVSANLKNSGKLLSLPMKVGTESLNAGVSASVLMYLLEGKNI